MQIKIFSVPVVGGDALNEEMNTFLRSKKIIQIEQKLVSESTAAVWTFCLKFVEDYSPFSKSKDKTDFRELLDAPTFERFSKFREIRKKLAAAENIPAYAIFTDEELAELAKMGEVTLPKMKTVRGIGDKKIEKYGRHFLAEPADETSLATAG